MPQPPVRITSLEDPRVDVFRDVRDRDLRGHGHLFMAESELVLRRLMRRPECLHSVMVSPRKYAELAEVLPDLPDEVPIFVAEIEVMTRIAGFHIHRGVLAAGHRPSRAALTIDSAFGHLLGRDSCCVLVAEGLTNVDNMGGLFRNAAAFGAAGILLDPTCCDPLYRKAVRVSMGHVLSVPYAISASWPGDLERLKREWGFTIVGAEVTSGARPLWTLPRSPRTAVVFGSEGHGLRPETLAACDLVVQIPMTPAVPSINVAAAAAVFMYELAREAPEGASRAEA